MNRQDLPGHIANTLNMKVESVPAAASYAANGTAVVYGTFTFNEWLALLGAILALATFFVNMRYQRRREAREARQEARDRELHQVKIQNLKRSEP